MELWVADIYNLPIRAESVDFVTIKQVLHHLEDLEGLMREVARVLKPDGEFRFVSDIDDYCAWTLAHVARSPDFVWTAERADDWRLPWADYTLTRYGAKAEREGRQATYLRFVRVG